MREYETVFITQPNLSDSQQNQIIDRFKTMIERNEGTLFFVRNMGKRALSYPIAKQTKGLYTCLDYAANGPAVGEIERNMRLDENVIRFLTTVKTEEIDVEARAAEIAARGEDKDPAEQDALAEKVDLKDVENDEVSDELPDVSPKAAEEE